MVTMICRLRFLKLCLSVAGMMVLASCGNVVLDEEEEGAVVTDGKCMLNVTCAFSQSIGDFPSTRLSLPSVVSRISFAVIQSGKVVWHDEQMCDNDEDDSFGKVTASLKRGACTLVIFAHNGDAALPFDDEGHVAPANHRVTDSFSYAADLMIDDSVTDVDCVLTRCISRLSLLSDDKVPSAAVSGQLVLTGVSQAYDCVSQCGTSSSAIVKDIPRLSVYTNADGHFKANVNVFIPDEEVRATAVIDFYNASGQIVCSKKMKDVRLKVNSVNNVSGLFFSSATLSPVVSVDDKWGEDITQVY